MVSEHGKETEKVVLIIERPQEKNSVKILVDTNLNKRLFLKCGNNCYGEIK